MEKIFEKKLKITTRDDYDVILSHVKKLITEATENGSLDDPEADNEYIREIGRLSVLGANYEDEYIKFEYIKRRTPVRTAKKLHKSLNIDTKLLEYA